MDALELAMGYVRSVISIVTSTISFFVGFYELLLEGLRGDWSGMRRLLRRWRGRLLEAITGQPWLPGDPRRRIRALYRRCLREAGRAGIGRSPHQTPRAFRRMVERSEPALAGGLADLTLAYEWARFSPHPMTPAHVTRATGG
jgi:hypothetical protein